VRSSRRWRRACAVAAVLCVCTAANAQWVTETFNLQAGWNSVFLQVDPANNRADAVFVTTPTDAIERVWTWRVNQVRDGDALATRSADWQVWLPASDPNSIVNTLVGVRGGQVYLVKATAPATLTITGTPNGSKTEWVNGSNVAGLYVDPSGPPTFDTYFAPSTTHASTDIFALQSDGSFNSVATSSNAGAGLGYWISTSGEGQYSGPIDVSSSTLRGLDYSNVIVELQVGLRNLSTNNRTVTLTGVESAPTPDPNLPANAGSLPLKLRQFTSDPNTPYTLETLDTSNPQTVQLGANGTDDDATQVLQLSVDRTTASLRNGGGQYQSLVQIRDGAGFLRTVPVSTVVDTLAGLYAGRVVVNQVAWVQADARIVTDADPNSGYEDSTVVDSDEGPNADTTTPRPTPAAFSFPVIIHFDGTSYTFLSEVTLLYQPDPNDPADPGRYVLATPSCGSACDALEPGSILDGEPFRRRISTANFSFVQDLPMAGSFTSQLTVPTLTIDGDDPLNPFLHRYHPDHDGDRPGEVLTVTRDISFDFTCPPQPGEFPRPGLGDALLNGCYSETLTGLHKEPINVAGYFELSRLSTIDTLNNVTVAKSQDKK
jgi:hypothetical protein